MSVVSLAHLATKATNLQQFFDERERRGVEKKERKRETEREREREDGEGERRKKVSK